MGLVVHAEQIAVFFWHADGAARGVEEDVFGFARDEESAGFGVADLVGEGEHAGVDFGDAAFGDDFVVVEGGGVVAAVGVNDGEADLIVTFHVAVADTADAAEFGTGHFEPDEVVGVVDDAHLVGFGVADAEADLGFVGKGHEGYYPAHGPGEVWQRGEGAERLVGWRRSR